MKVLTSVGKCLGVFLGLMCMNSALQAAILIPPSGSVTNTFDGPNAPTIAEGWSTAQVGTAAGTFTAADTLDTAVTNNTDATTVNVALTANGTEPPAQNATARWNSVGHYLQTRPTGIDYLLLMATVQNNTGASKTNVTIIYDWDQKNNRPVNESVPGHRVYYSLTGAPGSWNLIPDLSVFNNNSGAQRLGATIQLGTWANGALLYVLWADDNGPGGTTDPMEGAYTIDNIIFSTLNLDPRVQLVHQPGNTNIIEGFGVTFQVVAEGRPPLSYQWFRDGSPITDATNSTYTIPRVFRSDNNAVFTVQVTNNFPSSQTSSPARLTVTPDNTPPRVECVWGTNDNVTLFVQYSEIVTNAIDPANYTVFPTDGGDPLQVVSAVYSGASTNEGTIVVLTLNASTPWAGPNRYSLTVGAVFDVIGNQNDPSQIVPLHLYANPAIPIDAVHQWSYEQSGNDLGTAWRARLYDDSGWPTGAALLGNEGTALPEPFRTTLSLVGANGIQQRTYYFRTHFHHSGASSTGVLRFRTLLDDGAVMYLNGVEIWRLRMGTGTVTYDTEAPVNIGDATTFDGPVTLCVTNLLSGDNVIAVEVHQNGPNSSDITWGLDLQDLEVSVDPPTIVSQPQGTNVVENLPFTLRAQANGSNPQYQWYHNNTAIGGANAATYSVYPSDCDTHGGAYYVVVSNPLGSVTSSVVNVTVSCDVTVPRVTCVYGTNDTIVVVFSETTTNADFVFNYLISSTSGGPGLGLSSATYSTGTNTGTTVLLVIDPNTPRDPNSGYQIDISGAQDLATPPNDLVPVTLPIAFFVLPSPLINIDASHLWRYNDSGTDLGTGWRATGFADGSWPQGAGVFDAKRPARTPPLMIGGEPIRTVTTLSNAANTAQIPTHYFRTHFNYSGPASATFQIRALIDDGAVYYINGQEVLRVGMPEPPTNIVYSTSATRAPGDATNELVYACANNLVNGDNVLAVEVHQANLTSSDITFGSEVSLMSVNPPLQLTITRAGPNQVTVSWNGSGTLQQSVNLNGHPSGWANVSGVSGNSYTTTASGPQRFFRVRSP